MRKERRKEVKRQKYLAKQKAKIDMYHEVG
jgi:hypothetical protein